MVAQSTLWVRRQRRRIRRQRGNECEVKGCTRRRKLQMAHVRETKVSGIGRGSYTRVKDWRDNPKSYRLICSDHHNRMRTGEKLKFKECTV